MTSVLRTQQVRGILLFAAFIFSSSVYACSFSSSVFSSLDYGLYWYGYGNNCEKAVPGYSNAYYNKSKPVIIYIHGWQQDSSVNRRRETYNVSGSGGPAETLSDYWINRGYNVGILYWNQFADEAEVKDAEAKIWSVSGPRGMRWKSSNGSYYNGPGKTVTTLLYESFRDNLKGYSGSYIRIAGHSLGNQLAVTVTNTIYNEAAAGRIAQNLKPKRVALLDPFYSNNAKSYLNNQWTGAVARSYVSNLKSKGAIFESYRSSAATSTVFVGDENKGLLNMTSFVELKPWYFSSTQLTEKHIAARWHYFWSMNFAAPPIVNTTALGQSAATSDSRTAALMNGSQRLIHDLGAYTKSPGDDRFKYGSRL